LVPDGQDDHLVCGEPKAVLREIAGPSAEDHELAPVHVDGSADKRVARDDLEAVEDQWNLL
jgi:hypothetical protein